MPLDTMVSPRDILLAPHTRRAHLFALVSNVAVQQGLWEQPAR